MNGYVSLVRDVEGRITQILASGMLVPITYDAAGRVQSHGALTYEYFPDDAVSTVNYHDASTRRDFFGYDKRYPRLVDVNTSSNQGADHGTSFDFNPVTSPPTLGANRLAKATSSPPGVPYQLSQARPTPAVSYTYDELDRIKVRDINDGADVDYLETIAYDELGRPKSVTNALGSFTYGYEDASPRLSSMSSGSGPQALLAYYGASQDALLQSATFVDVAGNDLAQFSYGYNTNHSVTSFSSNYSGVANPNGLSTQQATYDYDPLNRLTPATVTGGQTWQTLTYAYDGDGNITSVTGATPNNNAVNVQYAYAGPGVGADQMNAVSYDIQSNALAAGCSRLDISGNSTSPIQYTSHSATRVTTLPTQTGESDLTYDALGPLVRIVDRSGGAVVADHSYFWCGNERCAEFDNTAGLGAPASKHYFAQGWLGAAGQSSFYYILDQLGSVRAVIDGNSQLRAQYEYDPWGNRRRVAGDTDSDLGFAGYFHHAASGLDFTMHRAYDSRFGRWLSPAPIGIAVGLNLYRYAGADPVSLV